MTKSRRKPRAGDARPIRRARLRGVSPVPSRGRRLAFHVAALLLPVVALGLAEVACRLSGFGGYPPVVARIGDEGDRTWYSTIRRGTDVFFSTSRDAPGGGMREIQFVSPKPPGTVRIVLLGESAIQGFPQPLPLTDGSFLEAMLRDAWQDERGVEVLNFGATAVASFPIERYIDDVLEAAQPDLAVIMAGNNEFYGAYGVAGLPGVARSALGMRLVHGIRGLALSQALSRALESQAPTGKTLMERAVAGQQVTPLDSRRTAAARSLRSHLEGMVRRCAARHVPVIVCTVPTNERDLAPIGTGPEPPRAAVRAFHETLTRAREIVVSEPSKAEELARSAIELNSASALAHYVRGEALTRLSRHDEALVEYVRARDLDAMPWRATSDLQQAVRDVASGGAVLCDMEAAFRAESPGGAIGWELLDDHVHMTLRGQALFARTIVSTLATATLSGATLAAPHASLHVAPEALARLPSWEAYADRLGRSVYSDFTAASHLRKLFAIPFMGRNNEAARLRCDSRYSGLLAEMSDVDRAAVERWYDPSLHGASERPLEYVVGVYRATAGDHAAAEPLFRFARRAVPAVSVWRLHTTWLLLQSRRHLHDAPGREDDDLIRDMVRVGELLERTGEAANPDVRRYLGLAYNLAGNNTAAVSRLEPLIDRAAGQAPWEITRALADSYLQLGRGEDARRMLERAARDPRTAGEAQSLLQRLPASLP
ncbi:MAG: tetratricopeptide repeat protein [bacterium]